jgi:hypothetical protein
MVIVNSQVPVLLTKRRGVNDKIVPIVKAQRIQKYNKDQRRMDEQETNDVKATAVILRISQQGKSKARTG